MASRSAAPDDHSAALARRRASTAHWWASRGWPAPAAPAGGGPAGLPGGRRPGSGRPRTPQARAGAAPAWLPPWLLARASGCGRALGDLAVLPVDSWRPLAPGPRVDLRVRPGTRPVSRRRSAWRPSATRCATAGANTQLVAVISTPSIGVGLASRLRTRPRAGITQRWSVRGNLRGPGADAADRPSQVLGCPSRTTESKISTDGDTRPAARMGRLRTRQRRTGMRWGTDG